MCKSADRGMTIESVRLTAQERWQIRRLECGRVGLMAINVRFFAALREQIGFDVARVSSAESGDIADLVGEYPASSFGETGRRALRHRTCALRSTKSSSVVDCTVRDGDEVAFMPPITGG